MLLYEESIYNSLTRDEPHSVDEVMAEIIKQTKRSTMEVADQGAKETSLPVPDPPSSDSVYTDMLHSPSWPRLTDEPFIAPPPSREFEDPPEDYDFAGYMSTQHDSGSTVTKSTITVTEASHSLVGNKVGEWLTRQDPPEDIKPDLWLYSRTGAIAIPSMR